MSNDRMSKDVAYARNTESGCKIRELTGTLIYFIFSFFIATITLHYMQKLPTLLTVLT